MDTLAYDEDTDGYEDDDEDEDEYDDGPIYLEPDPEDYLAGFDNPQLI